MITIAVPACNRHCNFSDKTLVNRGAFSPDVYHSKHDVSLRLCSAAAVSPSGLRRSGFLIYGRLRGLHTSSPVAIANQGGLGLAQVR